VTRIAFITRGRGFGHAARDLRIIEAMRRRRPDVEIDIASCGTGLEYYRLHGVPCQDMGIPDAADRGEAANWKIWRHLHHMRRPDLLVVDELAGALPFGRHVMEVETVYLTDYFPSDAGPAEFDRVLNLARGVFFVDFAAAHTAPVGITAPVQFTGPVIGRFGLDRGAAREAIGVGADRRLVVASLGGKTDMPLRRRLITRLLAGWNAGRAGGDLLILLAEPGPEDPVNDETVRWLGRTADPEAYYAAADAVVVDAMGFTACEVVGNGVPVVALTDPDLTAAFPRSFARRVAFMADQQFIVTLDAERPVADFWKCLAEAENVPPSRRATAAAMSANVDEVAAQILGSS
jgi:hypothetical protein